MRSDAVRRRAGHHRSERSSVEATRSVREAQPGTGRAGPRRRPECRARPGRTARQQVVPRAPRAPAPRRSGRATLTVPAARRRSSVQALARVCASRMTACRRGAPRAGSSGSSSEATEKCRNSSTRRRPRRARRQAPPAACAASQWCTAASWTWWRVTKATSCCQRGPGPARARTGRPRAAPRPAGRAGLRRLDEVVVGGARRPARLVRAARASSSATIVAQNQCTSVRCRTRSATDQPGSARPGARSAGGPRLRSPALCRRDGLDAAVVGESDDGTLARRDRQLTVGIDVRVEPAAELVEGRGRGGAPRERNTSCRAPSMPTR